MQACVERSLLVVADGASWIRRFFQVHLAAYPQAEMVLDWYHLERKCRDLGTRLCPDRQRQDHLLRRLLRALWRGQVPRALRLVAAQQRQGADPAAVEDLIAYLQARAAWIPDYRARRRQRRFIGNGLGEKANDQIVARRQKRRGMQWSARSSDALAALRTLRLNGGWERYWRGRHLLHLSAAA